MKMAETLLDLRAVGRGNEENPNITPFRHARTYYFLSNSLKHIVPGRVKLLPPFQPVSLELRTRKPRRDMLH